MILFAKAPIPGRVKTRLGIDPVRAAELHSAFVRQTLTMLHSLRDEADVELSTDEPTDSWRDIPVQRSVQAPGDLGARLYEAIRRALAEGHPRVVILGSDSPGLPPDHIRELLRSSADVAIGPTDDGGFYGIACRKAPLGMFEGIRWSTGETLRDTLRALERRGLEYELGPRWFDVDTPDDLARLGLQ